MLPLCSPPPLHGAEPGPVLIHSPAIVAESVAREAGIDNRHSRRFARVELEFDSLLHPAKPPGEGVEPTEFAPLAQSTVTIEPFPGEIYRLNGRYVEEWTDSAWSWVGAIEGYEYADFVVSVTQTGYFGMMRVGPIVYEIRHGSDGNTYIREPDIAAYELESACAHGANAHEGGKTLGAFDTGLDSKEPDVAEPGTKSSGGTAVIDILLLFTAGAASNYDIEALANSSIAWMNISFDDSDVDAVGRIIHYEASSYTAPPNVDGFRAITMAEQMKSTYPGNTFEEVTPLRNAHQADLALLIWDEANAGTTCGAGLAADSPSGNSETKWTANTGDGCISMFNNFTHEIGHNLGIGHDYPPNAGYQAHSYGNGFTYAGDNGVPEFRTIMGSDGSCSLSGCDRLNLWSDPGMTYQSQAIGVVNESDAVQALDTMASVIGGYRTPGGASPGAFGTVSIIRGLCFGDNWVNYSAPTGLIGWYEIETDSNSWFSSPDSFYRGVKESVPLEVTSSTWVRARACNSTGCNAWTPGNQTATYTSGCL